MNQEPVCHIPVPLAKADLRQMVRLVRLLHRLSQAADYRDLVYPQVPETARFDPGHDAVMMGYDFHVTADGPRLIEVNTNAGGGLLAIQAAQPGSAKLPGGLRDSLLQSFAAEFAAFTGGRRNKPSGIAIIDEEPSGQFLFPEMQAFAALFREWGVPTEIVDPAALTCSAAGVNLAGEPIELIYNRHCDFYLQTAGLAGLRAAYLAKSVCLTPNPHIYGLMGDKRRLALWSSVEQLAELNLAEPERVLCARLVPETKILTECDLDTVWGDRKKWVFKPTTYYGSKGVLLGEKISRKRFNELSPRETLLQKRIAPSVTEVPEYGPMKTDFRLYVYRQHIFGVTARLYRGQVTNMRTPGGGFAPVHLV